MVERLEPHGTWGHWDLDQFEPEIEYWRTSEHPPADVFDHVDRWWSCLKHPAERASAYLVSRVNDDESAPDETDIWGLWVPGSHIYDPGRGVFRVQCLFRLYELGKPRVVCEAFHTAAWRSQTDADLADGMG